VSWWVRIVNINAKKQSRAAKIVYQNSGENFKIIEDIRGVIMVANSQ
jgi:hypothetical protein